MAYKYGEEEKRVETLTFKEIKKDLFKNLLPATYVVPILVLCDLLMWTLVVSIAADNEKFNTFFGVFYTVFAVILTVPTLYLIASTVNTLLAVRTKKLKVLTDDLVDMRVEEHIRRTGLYVTHHLKFKCHGEYVIPKENYKWSNLFSMTDEGVYNYSSVGDTYYIVFAGSKKIALVYNTKLFKFNETDLGHLFN